MSTAATSWRPPQWNKPAMVSVATPPGYAATQSSTASNPTTNTYAAPNTAALASTSYVFDAVLMLEHEQRLTKTRHPVQTGPAISSHAYLEPATLVLDVLMSDVAPQYVDVNQTSAPYTTQFTGNPSKSVSAYQQMLTLQSARVPLTVTTRLRTYYNMFIDSIAPREDNKTITGARFRVAFGQIFIASTQITPNSTRPNDTGATGVGSVNPQNVPAAVDTQFNVNNAPPNPAPGTLASFLQDDPLGINVPGHGDYSSTNTNSLQQIPSP